MMAKDMNQPALYIPITSKIGLQKKQRQALKLQKGGAKDHSQEEEAGFSQPQRPVKNLDMLVIAGRGYT